MANGYDFVAIGDIVTDAFIRLKDASVHCNVNKDACEICLRFKDKVPYEEVYIVPAVGNSANAAVAAARLGLSTALVTNLGGDRYGEEALVALRNEKVATEYITVHPESKTNYHYVLWYGDDRTILIKHERYAYAFPDIGAPRWVYFSSLGEHVDGYHDKALEHFARHPETKLAFQPGTFQIKAGKEKMGGLYRRSEIVFCNKEEAQRILETDESDIKKLLAGMRDLGPKIAVVTDGTNGAYSDDGSRILKVLPYPDPKAPYERTGAGDAFSSTFTVALALGKSVEEAMRWAPVNSMSVVQNVGAQAGLLMMHELESYLKNAPADYGPQPF